MMRSICGLSILAIGWCSLGVTPAKAANIVVNPGFESGLAGWTSNFWGVSNSFSVFPGTQSAFTGCQPTDCITGPTSRLYQDLPTLAGSTYVFSFYFGDFGLNDGSPFELRASVDGTQVAYYTGSTPDSFFRFSLPAITFTATSTTTRIEFNGRDVNRFLYLDNVCVDVNGGACGLVQGGAFIPEPSTWMLVGAGLAGLWLRRRRPTTQR